MVGRVGLADRQDASGGSILGKMKGARVVSWIFLGVAVLVLAAAWYFRFSPSDPARWHRPIVGLQQVTTPNSALRLSLGDLAAVHQIALAWPRTTVVAGSPAAGRVTYLSRSGFWGFPDYTTVEQRADGLGLYGRARFGQSDFGVNAARIDAWLRLLDQR